MNRLLVFISVVFLVSCGGTPEQNIIGTWQFKEAQMVGQETDLTNGVVAATLGATMKNAKYEFLEDGVLYTEIIGVRFKGKYRLFDLGRKIELMKVDKTELREIEYIRKDEMAWIQDADQGVKVRYIWTKVN